MTQREHKCRYQKCDFHLSTFSPLELSCLTRNAIGDAKNNLQIQVAEMNVLSICKSCENE